MLINDIKAKLGGLGESSAIALANEINNSLLIIDEKRGREFAAELGLTITGTVGVVRQAYEKGIITKDESLVIIESLRNNDFRVSDKIIDDFKDNIG